MTISDYSAGVLWCTVKESVRGTLSLYIWPPQRPAITDDAKKKLNKNGAVHSEGKKFAFVGV